MLGGPIGRPVLSILQIAAGVKLEKSKIQTVRISDRVIKLPSINILLSERLAKNLKEGGSCESYNRL